MWGCVDLALTDVSEENIASIFRIEKSESGEPACRWLPALGFFYPENGGDTFLRNVY
jgi:hypothetical protein